MGGPAAGTAADCAERGYSSVMTAASLTQKVLALPYSERERVLAELLASLQDGGEADGLASEVWDRSWAPELETRLGEVEAGTMATIPADQVLAELRAGVLPARC